MADLNEMFPEWNGQSGKYRLFLEGGFVQVLNAAAQEDIAYREHALLQEQPVNEDLATLQTNDITLSGVEKLIPHLREVLMNYLLRTDDVSQELGWAGQLDEAFARAEAGWKAPLVYKSIYTGVAAAALLGSMEQQ